MHRNLDILADVDLSSFSKDELDALDWTCYWIKSLWRKNESFQRYITDKYMLEIGAVSIHFPSRDKKLDALFDCLGCLECDLCETEEGRMIVIR